MVNCKICGEKIGIKNFKEVFHFTLGNIINGKFYGEETIHYHIDCLNGKKHSKLLAPIN